MPVFLTRPRSSDTTNELQNQQMLGRKIPMKKAISIIIVAGIVCAAHSQINLRSDVINFREYSDAAHGTTHYGDLRVTGGSSGNSWGWFWCVDAYINRNALVYGNLNVYGSKNFLHPHPTDTTKVIKYVAIESGVALTVARGTASTSGGEVTVDLPEHFSLVTSDQAPLTVILTPEDQPVLLYTKSKARDRIVIGMKQDDYFEYGDATFAFQVTGVRDGFEDEEVIVNVDDINSEETVSPKRASYNKQVKGIARKIERKGKYKDQSNKKQ